MSATHTGITTEEFSQTHHDDAAREFAYDRDDKRQRFSGGWDEALARKWTVVSMRDEWNTIFPSAKN
jgi:hypothetical protein